MNKHRLAMLATLKHEVDDQPAKARLLHALERVELQAREPSATSESTSAVHAQTSESSSAEDSDSGEYFPIIRVASDETEDELDMMTLGLSRDVLNLPINRALRSLTRRAWDQIIALMPMRQDPKKVDVETISHASMLADELHEQLSNADAFPKIVSRAWATLARLSSLLLRVADSADGAIVLEAAKRTDGESAERSDLLNAAQVIPRAEAVAGLMWLAVRKGDVGAIQEIERLSCDSEAAVRFQVAYVLRELYDLGLPRAWPLVERLIRDKNAEVAAEAIGELRIFYRLDQEAALKLCAEAFFRFEGATAADKKGRTDALLQLAWYHLARAHPIATAAIESAVSGIPHRIVGIRELLRSFRDWLIAHAEESSDTGSGVAKEADVDSAETADEQESDELERLARERTVRLYKDISAACIQALQASDAANDPNATDDGDQGGHVGLLEDIAMQLYFASGAFRKDDDESSLPGAVVGRFYADFAELLVAIGTAGVISAANRILETLSYLLRVSIDASISASDVLDRFVIVAESAVSVGSADRYWLLDPIEEVLRRCVAEREPAFRQPRMVMAWAQVLDPLLEIGWDQAFRLARELDLSQ